MGRGDLKLFSLQLERTDLVLFFLAAGGFTAVGWGMVISRNMEIFIGLVKYPLDNTEALEYDGELFKCLELQPVKVVVTLL